MILTRIGAAPNDDAEGADGVTHPIHRAAFDGSIGRGTNLDGSLPDAVARALTASHGGLDGLALASLELDGPGALAGPLARAWDAGEHDVEDALCDLLEQNPDFALTGAEVVALLMRAGGVKSVFAYAGTSELALCDRLTRTPGVQLVNSRGDKEAAFMAAGAGFRRAVSGAAIIHGARGLTNACGAVVDSRRSELGWLGIVGLPSTGSAPFLPPHGEPDLLATFRPFVKSVWEAGPPPPDANAEEADAYAHAFAARLVDAMRIAATRPHGPALVGVPQDVAQGPWARWSVVRPFLDEAAAPVPRQAAPDDALAPALRAIAGAQRPLVFIDDYALRYDDAREKLDALSRALGAPVLQVRYTRGCVLHERLSAEHVRNFAGWYDAGHEDHQDLMAATDLLITVEDRNMYPRVVGELPDCRKVAITSDRAKVEKNRYLHDRDLLLEGDVTATIGLLLAALGAGGDAEPWARPAPPERGYELRPEVERVRGGIADALADFVRGRDAVVIDDSSMFGGMLTHEYDRLPPELRVIGAHGGFVGYGIPLAAGMAAADPGCTVLCLCGDQGFTNAMQGLVAVGEQRWPVTYVVANNGEAVSLHKQAEADDPLSFDRFRDRHLRNGSHFSYARLAQVFGIDGHEVDLREPGSNAEIDRALDDLRGLLEPRGGPVVVELRLPPLGDFWTGIWEIAGRERVAVGAGDGA